jgi:hypothetical protein
MPLSVTPLHVDGLHDRARAVDDADMLVAVHAVPEVEIRRAGMSPSSWPAAPKLKPRVTSPRSGLALPARGSMSANGTRSARACSTRSSPCRSPGVREPCSWSRTIQLLETVGCLPCRYRSRMGCHGGLQSVRSRRPDRSHVTADE